MSKIERLEDNGCTHKWKIKVWNGGWGLSGYDKHCDECGMFSTTTLWKPPKKRKRGSR